MLNIFMFITSVITSAQNPGFPPSCSSLFRELEASYSKVYSWLLLNGLHVMIFAHGLQIRYDHIPTSSTDRKQKS